MSRLDDLINEYCPEGVEYRKIQDCVRDVSKIKWNKLDNKKYKYVDLTSVDLKTHKIANTQEIYYDNAPSRAQQIIRKGDILLGTTRPLLKRYCIIDDEYDNQICSTGFCVLRADGNLIKNNFLYHCITSTKFFNYVEVNQQGASYPSISDKNVKNFKIPLPPLPVQEEIVRILDTFTELTTELNNELTLELTLRKKQYEYYRNGLLKFGEDSRNLSLKDILQIKNGKDYKQYGEGYVPVYGSGGIMTYIDTYVYDKPSVLIPRKGSLNKLYYVDHPFWTVDTIFYTIIDEEIAIPKYVYYCLQSKHLEKLNNAGGVPSLTQAVLNKVEIPIPSMKAQERIVYVLDHFDRVCNDLNIGLPAEIEARNKQYEYYRDSLLSFKVKEIV